MVSFPGEAAMKESAGESGMDGSGEGAPGFALALQGRTRSRGWVELMMLWMHGQLTKKQMGLVTEDTTLSTCCACFSIVSGVS